jgi:hypothetical protein
LPPVFRPIRTAISAAVLLGCLWAAFAVDLGDKTFAEHVDTISETPEAKQLVDDTRATINPALAEVRDRVLGEYVEAPTWIPESDAAADPSTTHACSPPRVTEPEAAVAVPPLPGRPRLELQAPEASETALPGRRR